MGFLPANRARLTAVWGACVAFASALPTLALAQEDTSQRRYPDGVVAVVDGVPITRHELELASQLRGDYRELTPGSTARRKILDEELKGLIQQRILVNKARKENVKFDESDERRLKLELGRHGQRYGGPAGLKRALEQIGVPYDYFVARQKANVLVSKLLVKSVPRDIFIPPEEIRRHYARVKGKKEHQRKGLVRYRQIVAYTTKREAVRKAPALAAWKGPWDGKAYLEALRARVVKGEDFAKVAADGSIGPKHAEEIVVTEVGRLHTVFFSPMGQKMERMRPGDLSEVIENVRGEFFLILLVDRREPGPLPIEELQKQIEYQLKERAWQKKLEVWVEGLRREATIRVFLPGS